VYLILSLDSTQGLEEIFFNFFVVDAIFLLILFREEGGNFYSLQTAVTPEEHVIDPI
jgi:hypothetical protein